MNAHTTPIRPTFEPFVDLPDLPVFAELRERRQWVAWDYVWKPAKAKFDKVPLNPILGGYAKVSNPATWGTYEEAAALARRRGLPGVGFVLTKDDPFVGGDLDDVAPGGAFLDWAADVVDLGETYVEFSPSGQGVRILARRTGDEAERTLKHDAADVELYVDGRYLTLTGRHVEGTPTDIRPAPRTLAALHRRVARIKAEAETAKAQQERADTRRAPPGGPQKGRFFRAVNDRALADLDVWVRDLFPTAKRSAGTRGWRVSARDLGRDLEEDLSLTPGGIVDFGVHDMGDPRAGKRTAIDVVIEHGGQPDAPSAAFWLCEALSVQPEDLGWREPRTARSTRPRSGAAAHGRGERREPEGASEESKLLPEVYVVSGSMPAVVDETERTLIASGADVFARGHLLVRPIVERVPAAHGRETTVARFKALSAIGLMDELGRVMRFRRFDGRSQDWIVVNAPNDVAMTMLEREGKWSIPIVAGIITTPTLRPDGSLLSTPGYDPATKLFLALDPDFRMPALPERPTRADAERALTLLNGLLTGFPFVGPTDRAVALSGLLTALLRGVIGVAPLHAIRAHTPGTGKSYLVDVASCIATGRCCPVIAAGKSEEETEKRLGALLRDAIPVISLDNVNGELGGDMLCQLTERPLVRVRILGRSEAPEMECRSVVFATGNNLTLVGDMTRRTVLCTLDARVERPELRQFAFDPVARVLADRGAYVAAILTIIRAYRAAGSPKVCDVVGSYGDWSATVRAPLVWLGEADPVGSMETARDEDPELTAIGELFGHWREHFSVPSNYTSNAVIQVACERSGHAIYGGLTDFRHPEFRDLLLRQAGDGGAVSSRRLGKWLSRISGRVVDGYRLEMKADPSNGSRFSLHQVGEAPASAAAGRTRF